METPSPLHDHDDPVSKSKRLPHDCRAAATAHTSSMHSHVHHAATSHTVTLPPSCEISSSADLRSQATDKTVIIGSMQAGTPVSIDCCISDM